MNSYTIAEEILVYHVYPKNYLLSLRFIIGTIIFFIGFIFNLQADAILRNLRKDNNQRDYQIPRGRKSKFCLYEFDVFFEGGLFEYVSGANFLAESIEWTGYAICAWTLPALAFSVFTWANIAFGRAIHHHQYVKENFEKFILFILFRFYLDKFKDEYPKNRKAIIPFIL